MLLGGRESRRDDRAPLQIDGPGRRCTRLLLEAWISAFARRRPPRRLSVVCGIAAVVLIFELGRFRSMRRRPLAAWLAAISPLLIFYSREVRMYSWLVLVTCLCWRLLLAWATPSPRPRPWST